MLPPEPSPQDTMLQQAVEAIRQEKFAQARELLTRMIRTDQNNPVYWVWLSAAMETQKERLYCLQTAYKLDPTDPTTRRGLILLGALPPDDGAQPFPMNHPRPWEAKLKLADEKPKVTGIKRFTGNPMFRLASIVGVGLVLIVGAVIWLGSMLRNRPVAVVEEIGTPRPTVTQFVNPNAAAGKPTLLPLAQTLVATYTPTPIYAATPHADMALDSYKGAMRAYNNSQWDNVAIMMEQVATAHPGSADALYFIGEARRLSGKYADAIEAYNQAINTNPNYAPSYLGRARANFGLNPRKNVIADLNLAIDKDPFYAEAYMERADYFLRQGDLKAAKADLEQAESLNPGSPLIQVKLARLLLESGETEAALEAAKKANELDVVMLDGYLVLGMAYRANGQVDQAVELLEIYVQYQPDSSEAFMVLGAAYFNRGDYETARQHLTQAIRLDKTSSEAYYWLGELDLLEGDNESAVDNFEKSVQFNANSFRNVEGQARSYLAVKKFGEAYIAISQVEKMADTDQKRAQFLYIRAIANEALSQPNAAIKDWNELLALPAEAMSAEIRAEAEAKLANLRSPTPEAKESSTPTETPAPQATRQPTKTPVPTNTRAPSATPTP